MKQQRSKKKAEAKESEERVNIVWDDIKEIHNLEENDRFYEMNLVH